MEQSWVVAKERDVYSTKLVDIMRTAGVVVPVIILIYGALALFDIVGHSPLLTLHSYLVIFVVFMAVGAAEILVSRETYARLTHVFLVVYTIAAAAYAIWVGGFNSPSLFSWIVLLIACDLYFGRFWLVMNAFVMTATSVVAYLMLGGAPITTLIGYVSVSVFVAIVGLVVSAIRSVQVAEHTDLQQAKQEQKQQYEALLTIINAMNQAIFTVSERGNIRLYNATFLSLVDTNDSLSGKAIDDILPLYDTEGEAISLYSLMGKMAKFERDDLVLRFADGDSIRLSISVNRIQSTYSADRHASGRGFVCIARDVTKEKSLDDERDEFISVVSHELRTPVAIAEGTISNVQYFMQSGADVSKLSGTLKDAHDQILLLSNMINDLGTLSRAERGVGDQLEEIDLRELAETLYKSYNESATAKKLTLNLDTSARLGKVTTSRLYLEELLQNLITNAIKYTQEGSVTLSVHHVAGGTEFSVKDTGIGIGKSDLKHIFEKFYRSEDYRTRETSGTGLGLYVVQKLMKKLGTTVMVKSRLNHGSTFSFVLSDKPPKTKA